MRAGLAALSVLIGTALVAPTMPAAAQCSSAEAGPGPSAAGPPPQALPLLLPPLTAKSVPPPAPNPSGAPPRPAVAPSPAAVLGATPRLAMRSDALAAQMPAPLAPQPSPYSPYQSHTVRGAPLTSEQVAPALRARGFVDVSAVRQRGRSFLAEATGPRGERVRLVLDAESGEISGMQVIGFNAVP